MEIIGEAANGVAEETRHALDDLPWRDVVDMRNRLIHGYYDINHDIVWSTLQQDLPELVRAIGQALGQSGKASEGA